MRAAAPPWHAQAGAPSTLRQCLVLAALLHVLAVLVFGNTAGGTAAPGQGVWGVLNIRLAGIDPAGRADATVASDAYSGPQGQARERRWGGAVRAPQDRPDAHGSPGAARQGVWQPQPAPDAAPGPSPEVPPAAAADLAPAADPAPAPAAVPPLVSAVVPAVVPADLPAVVSAPAAAADRVPLPARPAEASVHIAPSRLPAPAVPAPPDLPLPALNLPAPPPPPSPAPEPALPPRSAPARPVRPAGVQAPALAAPAAGPMPLPGLAMPPPEPQPVARSPAPRALPAPIPAPAETTLPAVQAPALQTLPADAVPASVPIAVPTAGPAATPTATAAATTTATATAATANATPAAAAAPAVMAPAGMAVASPRPAAGSVDLTGRSTGAPDAGAQVGHDVATAPALPASAPRLNLTLVRPLGGPVSAQGARGLLPVLPHPPEQPNKLSRGIEKAGQPDCRQAYADKGLLAVLPLVADAVRDKGCRW